MLNIKILCVGKLKEKYLTDAQAEYLKRLSKYCKLEVIEIEDEKFSANIMSDTEIEKVKNTECTKIIDKINKCGKCSVICLDLTGKQYDSVEFAEKINEISIYESSTLIFVIGGSLGLTNEMLKLSNTNISFSKLTFPHQLIRIFLLEQIFRAFKILNNETYHH